jgi:hypothetical protein
MRCALLLLFAASPAFADGKPVVRATEPIVVTAQAPEEPIVLLDALSFVDATLGLAFQPRAERTVVKLAPAPLHTKRYQR